jgi:aconitase A
MKSSRAVLHELNREHLPRIVLRTMGVAFPGILVCIILQ